MAESLSRYPDILVFLFIMFEGMVGWFVLFVFVRAILWLRRRLKGTLTYRYARLSRENSRLKKHISQLRKELLCTRGGQHVT